MNKEREEEINKIKHEAKMPYSVSPKSIERFIARIEPMSAFMRDYFRAFFSANNYEEKQQVKASKLANLTATELVAFEKAYYDCLENEMNFNKQVA